MDSSSTLGWTPRPSPRRYRPRVARFHPFVRDSLLPLAFAVVATAEVLGLRPGEPTAVLAAVWTACLALVFRRRWTLAAGTLGGSILLLPYLGPALDELSSPVLVIWLASFSLGRWLPDLRGLPVAVLFVAFVLSPEVVATGQPPPLTDVLWVGLLALSPYAVGIAIRSLDARHRHAVQTAERLAAGQERVREEAAAAERARIARELHDVLAHSVSAMVLQVSAAEDLVRTDPGRATELLRAVTSVGRGALAETGRLLHLIRDTEGELGLSPAAGLDRLPDLVDGFRRSGLPVELAVEVAADGLPPGVDLSAYRIVQEALTNALRHGDRSPVAVRIGHGAAQLDIRVENGVGAADTPGSRLGLVGVAERVAVFGGRLEHGPTGNGRYLLHVMLPLAEPAR